MAENLRRNEGRLLNSQEEIPKGKTKIAFLIPGLGKVERGAEHAVLELSKRLSRDFEIIIFSRGYPQEFGVNHSIKIRKIWAVSRDNKLLNYFYKASPKKIKAILDILNLSPQGLEMLSFSLLLLPILIFEKFDILFPVSGLWGALLCRAVRVFKNTPFVYASHGGEEPLIAKQKPDVYVALTRYTESWLNNHYPKLKVVYIPNGVDTQKFSPKGEKVNIGLERPIILTVAHFIESKRIDLAIWAVAKLKVGSLLIVGDGPLKSKIVEKGRRELGARFKLVAVGYNKMPAYYRSCDVFTLPSFADPAPLVYLEAAGCNLPLVAPDDDRRKLEIGDAAVYCEVENADDYARALRKALRKKIGTREWAIAHSWDKIASQYKKLLFALVEKNE